MKCYHGTPIGGTRQDVARFLMGRDALVPFARPDDLPVVLECARSFIVDCSSYSIWMAGKGEVDYDAYVAWCQTFYRHPGFEWAIIPDIIDGTEEQNYRWVRDWLRWPHGIKGVPVWHLHESMGYLDYLVSHFELVALGSSGQWATPGTPDWWARMGEAMDVICDEHGRPRCKLHGLRMLDIQIFTKLPLSSGDSTNAAVNCGSLSRFGSYVPPTAAQRAAVIAARIESHNSAHIWERQMAQQALLTA
jgi:hypothetical protein